METILVCLLIFSNVLLGFFLYKKVLENKKYTHNLQEKNESLIKHESELQFIKEKNSKLELDLQNKIQQLQKLEDLKREIDKSNVELQFLQEKNQQQSQEINTQAQQIESLQNKNKNWQIEIEKLKAENDLLQQKNSESVENLRRLLQENKDSFQVLAQEIANKTVSDVKNKSEAELKNIVQPLKGEIDIFNKELKSHIHHNTTTISNFRGMFEQFTKSISKNEANTVKLTDALLGNNKTQGSWGEWTLERVLQSAGLQREIDYRLQEHFVDDSKIKRPDAVIYLPDNKHIIVDAKMSLLHYYEYVNGSEENREANLKLLKQSIGKHIKDLASKNYSDTIAIDSISMVFLFIPIEALFQLIATDAKVMDFSYQHKIILVSPSTLYSSLYAIAYVRRLEKQTENINNIIDEVGKFYDKCCLFLEDFLSLGRVLQKANETFEGSMNKLQTGRGNIIDRMLKIKKMGVSSKKEVPESLQKEVIEEN